MKLLRIFGSSKTLEAILTETLHSITIKTSELRYREAATRRVQLKSCP